MIKNRSDDLNTVRANIEQSRAAVLVTAQGNQLEPGAGQADQQFAEVSARLQSLETTCRA